jgi:hypothetical protein
VSARVSEDLQEYKLTAQADKAVIITAVHKPFFARTTRAVVDDGLHAHAVAHSEALRYTFSHLFNRA